MTGKAAQKTTRWRKDGLLGKMELSYSMFQNHDSFENACFSINC